MKRAGLCVAATLGLLAFIATPALAELKLERFALSARNANGAPDVQAGSHPYALNTTFVLSEPGPGKGYLKDVKLELPPGFVGNPNATPKCSYQAFIREQYQEVLCPSDTAVGIATTYLFDSHEPGEVSAVSSPVYNLVPQAGVAAEFGYIVAHKTPILLETSVRTGTDYGLDTTVSNINQAVVVAASKVTIWGDPAEASHNPWRGGCERQIGGTTEPREAVGEGLRAGEDELEGPLYRQGEQPNTGLPESQGECPSDVPPKPLLTNPTSCGTPRSATFGVDSWDEPGIFHSKETSLPQLTGCEKLDFSPTIGVEPDGKAGSTPTGLNVAVHVPQEATENPTGSAEADVRNTTVALPAGVQISPSASDGLQACSTAQVGFESYKELDESGYQTAIFKPEVYNEATKQEESTLCPTASKIANVRIKTPLLEHELTGEVYLAAPQNFRGGLPENPFSSLFALYLVAEEQERGVLIKVAGKVSLSESGQLTTTFENTPQLPYSETKLEFYGTDRAPLATPAYCGTYQTDASFTPWTAPPGGTSSSAVPTSSDFNIESGPNGSPCSNPLPFKPSLASDTTNIQGGAFSPLETTFSREDGQQSLSGITLHYPPGLSGILTGIPLCGEAEANAGTCSDQSKIGETIVSVGLGNDPFSVTGGKVYLTGPYDGAPFGLSIVNPAKAGPFDLQEGRPVVVRAKIEVNPITAALTVTTTGEIPHIIEGVPLQIKHVFVNVNRSGFTFNPTNCSKMQVEGTIASAEGASAAVSTPFQAGECRSLSFTPKFSVSTSGKTSRAKGASLTLKVTRPSGPGTSEANFALAKIELPKQLPSRLTTLQRACVAKVFEANPAACPSESDIGHVKVITPLLPVPLEGPAYFVSHGGEAFPSVIFVLQGYGVTIDAVSTTFISKSGITSATLKTIPDAPFTSFELTFPEKQYSALAANGNLCKPTKTVTVKKKVTVKVHGRKRTVTRSVKQTVAEPLTMPTEFVAQNGAEIHVSTPISVTGCSKAKPVKKASKKHETKSRKTKGKK